MLEHRKAFSSTRLRRYMCVTLTYSRSAVKREGLWVKPVVCVSFSVLGSFVIAHVFHTGNYQKAFVYCYRGYQVM